ncbi:hypothetical protein BDFB_010116, partial [Asbolus verrucosus]
MIDCLIWSYLINIVKFIKQKIYSYMKIRIIRRLLLLLILGSRIINLSPLEGALFIIIFVRLILDSYVRIFYNIIYSLLDKYVPRQNKRKLAYPPWFSTNIIRNLRLKFRVWSKYKKYHNYSDFVTFKKLRRDIKSDIATAFSNFHKDIENQIGNDPNSFWNYINSKKRNSTVPFNMTYGGEQISGIDDIVNCFACHFQNSKEFTNTSTLLTLFFAFVSSKMEYANIIWFPYLVTYIADIKRVQRRFLKYLRLREDGIDP